jgi:hypothetical protein
VLNVLRDGTTEQAFNAKIVNLGRSLLETLYIPFFCDAPSISREVFQPWAKAGRKHLPTKLDFLDERRSQGRLAIEHVPPLKPGERRRTQWGFVMPHVFRAGDEYYDWDVEVPYYDMAGTLEFANNWTVLYARWEISKDCHFDPPIVEQANRVIRWRVMFPEPGTRLHLRLGLRDESKKGQVAGQDSPTDTPKPDPR